MYTVAWANQIGSSMCFFVLYQSYAAPWPFIDPGITVTWEIFGAKIFLYVCIA